jgi:hypothetical protein
MPRLAMSPTTKLERLQIIVATFRNEAKNLSSAEVVDRLFSQRLEWFELIKALRMIYEVSILDAERMALAHEGWRRWCNSQINESPRCRKMAWHHVKLNGPNSLLIKEGDRFRVI